MKKIQITTVDSEKSTDVNKQRTVLLLSHMTQGYVYRKNTILQYNTTNVNDDNVEVEK